MLYNIVQISISLKHDSKTKVVEGVSPTTSNWFKMEKLQQNGEI